MQYTMLSNLISLLDWVMGCCGSSRVEPISDRRTRGTLVSALLDKRYVEGVSKIIASDNYTYKCKKLLINDINLYGNLFTPLGFMNRSHIMTNTDDNNLNVIEVCKMILELCGDIPYIVTAAEGIMAVRYAFVSDDKPISHYNANFSISRDLAQKILDRKIKSDIDTSRAYYALGLMADRAEQYDDAYKYYRRAYRYNHHTAIMERMVGLIDKHKMLRTVLIDDINRRRNYKKVKEDLKNAQDRVKELELCLIWAPGGPGYNALSERYRAILNNKPISADIALSRACNILDMHYEDNIAKERVILPLLGVPEDNVPKCTELLDNTRGMGLGGIA